MGGFGYKGVDAQSNLLHRPIISKHLNSSVSGLQQLSEEKETENENDLQPLLKVLPFNFSYYAKASEPHIYISEITHSIKSPQPIYLSVSNFRI